MKTTSPNPAAVPAENAPAGLKRRGMLFGLGAAGALAAAATTAVVRPQGGQAAATPPAAQPPEQGPGYRLSQHVLRYYETTKV